MNLNDLILLLETEAGEMSKVPRRSIEDIIGYHLKLSWSQLQLNQNLSFSDQEKAAMTSDLKRLYSGELLAHILGEAPFFKQIFKSDHRALVPRPETEILVEKILQLGIVQKKIVDIGAGTGCIGLSLASEEKTSFVSLIDASSEALSLCQENVDRLGLSNVEMLLQEVHDYSSFPKWKESIDIVVANPPYIALGDSRVENSVDLYEPHQALYAEEQGCYWIRTWLDWAHKSLKSGGYFLFEFGQGQEVQVEPLISSKKYHLKEWVRDYAQITRFVILQKK